MNPKVRTYENTRKLRRQAALLALFAVITLVALASLTTLSSAADTAVKPQVTIAQLKGPWAMTLTGVTGCGATTMYVTFTLNAKGSGDATQIGHSSGCGDGKGVAPFVIRTLNANGSGTANLSCGSGCGWDFIIQVSPDHKVFNLVDVTNVGNFVEGTAIFQ